MAQMRKHMTHRLHHHVIWLVALFSLFVGSPATQASTRITTTQTHFAFSYPARWKSTVEPIIKHAEQDLATYQAHFGIQWKGVIKVRFATPGKAFANIQPHHWQPYNNIAGLAYPKRSLITIRIKGIDGLKGLRQTFQHELCHILIAHAAGYRPIPLWFNEGVAMMLTEDFGTFEQFVSLAQARLAGQLPRLSALTHRFPRTSPNQSTLAYSLSTDAVLFLQKQKATMLKRIVRLLKQGNSFEQAVAKTIGTPWPTIQAKWRKSLGLRYGWLPLIANESTIWFIALVLFVFAYFKIKAQRKKQFEQMEDEDEQQHSQPILH
jgi:hypothetical protein